ncbi:MAG TPA: cytochrome c oxidase assembly protein [Streptosporangiaceae bacterium]|nr:cytochrome c oxidase assembly protein [Streptosporangiaceae bacterium]
MDGIRMQRWSVPRGRTWLAVAALLLVVVCILPPAGTVARRYVFAESLQFVLFAVAIPALFVLGAPWRALGFAGRPRPPRGTRPGRRGFGSGRGFATLVAFIAAVIAWRLPVSVDALATVPGLVVAEMLTLGGVGSALWLELVESPPLLPRVPRPLRAFFAALAMWTIWILAYILGFSHVAWFTAYSQPGLSPVADQEIATGIMWAVPALCFVPFWYATILTWLKDSEDPDEGLRALVSAENPPRSGRWPRPPRGWDTHST